jgi:tritrans,polycis-undecaprenyl-diphosphate synthase [geranylgeranyl-diphosphate specific]
MLSRLRRSARGIYARLLERELDGAPSHVAVIQDGNRRYARERGEDHSHGHRVGAETTESMLEWCADLGVEELTLYAFSTENFDRPEEEREELFDLIESKLRAFADREEVHERGVNIRAIGRIEYLPERVRDAVAYAERRTAGYDRLQLNVALAYGGRAQLLDAARDVAEAVERGELDPETVDAGTIEERLPDPSRDVDLIIRTGGDARTSNFLPWHANGNEAAVFFCAPYWPEFRRIDLLRAVRTYESREASWRRTRTRRALALVRAVEPREGLRERLCAKVPGLEDALQSDAPGGERRREREPEPAAD